MKPANDISVATNAERRIDNPPGFDSVRPGQTARKGHSQSLPINTMVNQCVICGAEMPEGDQVCKGCITRSADKTECDKKGEKGMASMTRTIKRDMERQALHRGFNANKVRCTHCGKPLWRKDVSSWEAICTNCEWLIRQRYLNNLKMEEDK